MVGDFNLGSRQNVTAAGSMSVTVLVYSLAPLMVAVMDVAQVPFLFNAALQVGGMAGYVVVLLVAYRPLIFDPEVWTAVRRRILAWSILLGVVSGLDYALFVWATRFIDISIATILFETWPFFLIALTAVLFRRSRRYRRITFPMLLLLTAGFAGCAFVIAGQSGGFSGLGSQSDFTLLLGVILAVGSAVMTSLAAYLFKWGSDLSLALPRGTVEGYSSYGLELFGVAVAIVITDVFSIGLNAAIGFGTGESLNVGQLVIGCLGGVAVYTVGSITWRVANVLTDNLGINALGYSTPLIALLWLLAFSQVGEVRVDFLIIGAAAIIVANLLINFEAEVRFGFKALILCLWGCGAFVYLRDDLLELLPVDAWAWPGDSYFEAVALSATVFILLLSFRVARLVTRTRDEDNRTFLLFQAMEVLVSRNVVHRSIRDDILAIDGARSPEQLRDAYMSARDRLTRPIGLSVGPEDRKLLADARAQLYALTHSRQQGIDFGELFALVTFGATTVVLALASRPRVSGWNALLVELFTVLFSAVIAFLVVNVWDLQRDRSAKVLEWDALPGDYNVVFREAKSRRFEQAICVIVGALVTAAYAGLLWGKWIS